MPSRHGAIHVATTERRYKGKVYRTHLLRRTYREDGKVKHETLGNISHLPAEVIDVIRRMLKGQTMVPAEDAFECVRSLPHGHVAAALGSLRKLGLPEILAAKRSRERDLVVAMIVARIVAPLSKLATTRELHDETASSTLGELLSVADVTAEEMYAAMDWLLERQERIENRLAERHLAEGTLVLYDVSSTYFEGRCCPLAQLGHNRDGKKGKLQIVFGILCDPEGCPVAVQVFKGNTADPKTVGDQVTKVRKRFGLKRLVIVGDRGMLTEARIREDLRGDDGLSWITALRAPAIRRLREAGAIQVDLFDERDLAEIRSPDFPGERLIVCRNPALADERRRKRQELLAASEAQLQKIATATQRPLRPLRGKDKIGLRVGRVIDRFKMAKHFVLEITDESFVFRRNRESIEEEEALDGFYVIRTDLPETQFSAQETVRAYKSLSSVERAFRTVKTVDLKIRPIYHYSEDRVRAHVFLCMLAYYVEWHMRRDLAPILFDDEEPEVGEAMRPSVVAPAQRSPRALEKAASKRTVDHQPVHSFRTLLADLATLVKNVLRPRTDSRSSFTLITNPTPVQKKAFELLGFSPLSITPST
jgi:hypothetical protein